MHHVKNYHCPPNTDRGLFAPVKNAMIETGLGFVLAAEIEENNNPGSLLYNTPYIYRLNSTWTHFVFPTIEAFITRFFHMDMCIK